ncbi:GLPGLI family protein [Pontibacter locisalis]|uniref:GLPGLI family protein n=1 Tax=Pontibacter locisalis TaxID=1719035 RepID=A0ABW5II98_9BACT
MKSILTILGAWMLVIVSPFASAQSQGAITFETKINMHRNLPQEREAMKDRIPEFRTTRQILTFNDTESLYKPLIDEQDDMAAAGNGGQMVIMRTPQNQTYLNTAEAKKVSLREFMGKNYLIHDSLTILPWKFGNGTKVIQGYTCRQAFYTDEKTNKTTVAWYTDQLRPSLGPDNYNSLPGAVLEVDFDNGLRITKATKVELRNLKKNDLVQPAKGEKVTEKEYQELIAEQMKKMGNGNFIIRN